MILNQLIMKQTKVLVVSMIYTSSCIVPEGERANARTRFPAFAVVKSSDGLHYINNQSKETVFPGRQQHHYKVSRNFFDLLNPGGVPFAAELLFIHRGLFATMTILSILGIIFATICLVFNLACRKKQYIL